jgi:Spy/CpxP family protein refolding chaperone
MLARLRFLGGVAVLLVVAVGQAQPPGGFPGGPPGGFPGGRFEPPQPGQILPGFIRDQLKLTAEQKKQLGALQKDVDAKLAKILTAAQKKSLQTAMRPGPGAMPGGFPGAPGKGLPPKPPEPPQPGEILPGFIKDQLKLTAEQTDKLDALQKDVDEKLDKLLTEDQKKKLQTMRPGPGGGFGPGGPGK